MTKKYEYLHMKKIGITGQSGFVGSHLYNTLGLNPEQFERIDFKNDFFENTEKLDEFVQQCDVIVHLAAMNRHPDAEVIYNNNSFIATFCHKLTHGETAVIDSDGEVKLIYVGQLVNEIISKINSGENDFQYEVPHTSVNKVSEILSKLENFKTKYFENGEIPELVTSFDYNLFNTFRCYFDIASHYPVKFTQHTDPRGAFVEVIRLGIGGQCSFSTTVPGITRGNHFHTRKIERFAVIKGKALIQLRKIDSDEVLDFYLDGTEPAYVDMPIWYTHNIKNIGEEDLYTIFWINEPYDPADPDTYFVEV